MEAARDGDNDPLDSQQERHGLQLNADTLRKFYHSPVGTSAAMSRRSQDVLDGRRIRSDKVEHLTTSILSFTI